MSPGDKHALGHSGQGDSAGGAHVDVEGVGGGYGRGVITLAATLSALSTVSVAGIALLLGVDRFMSQIRSLTNLAGNAVATLVVAR